VVEDDEPTALLERDASMFGSMVDKTGRSSSMYLRGIASKASAARMVRGHSEEDLRVVASLAEGAEGEEEEEVEEEADGLRR
jgi:hypothetical protein